MVKNFSRSIKTAFAAVFVMIMALCFAFVAIGCEKDESEQEYLIRIAKEEFDCERILWYYAAGDYRSELVSVYLYDTYGYLSLKPWQSLFNDGKYRRGTYVLGVDKHGNEKFIAIPPKERTKENPRLYSPRLIQWPFAYSFTEIAGFAAEHGYKYADGIDNYDKILLAGYYDGLFCAIDCQERFMNTVAYLFENAEEKYAELDSELVLYYAIRDEVNTGTQHVDGTYCYIMQEGGDLKMYEEIWLGDESVINIITYERNKQDAES